MDRAPEPLTHPRSPPRPHRCAPRRALRAVARAAAGRHRRRAQSACGARTVIARETAETLADHDPPVLRTAIGQRVIYADAAQSGRLAFEIDDDGPAAREIAALASEIEQLRIGRIAS